MRVCVCYVRTLKCIEASVVHKVSCYMNAINTGIVLYIYIFGLVKCCLREMTAHTYTHSTPQKSVCVLSEIKSREYLTRTYKEFASFSFEMYIRFSIDPKREKRVFQANALLTYVIYFYSCVYDVFFFSLSLFSR